MTALRRRRLPRRRLVPLVVAGALVWGACGDGGEGAAPASTTSSTGVTTTAAAPTGSPAPGEGEAGATTVPTAGGGTTPTSPAPTTAAGSRAGAGRSPGSSTVGPAAPGRYSYATTGRFSSPLVGEQRRDGETVLTVDAAAGADQRSVRQGPGGVVEQVLRFQPDGAYLVVLKQSSQGYAKEFRPAPPALAFPAGPPPGRTWSWRVVSTDGQTTVDAAFRLARHEDVAVGGTRVRAAVVEATTTTSGDIVSTGRQTLWVSEEHRLVVRQQEVTDGRVGTLTFHTESDDVLRSLTPA